MKKTLIPAIILCVATAACSALAGNLDSPGEPPNGSNMPSLQGIYNQLSTGVSATSSPMFMNPLEGPIIGTGRSLVDIQSVLPVANNTSGATVGEVLQGKTFWGLRTEGTWGQQSGVMSNNGDVTITPGTTSQAIAAGYHNGLGTVKGDANLTPANIKAGTTIFGVTGSLSSGYTCTGTLSTLGRWCDNGNGTVRDMTTGLIWLKEIVNTGSISWTTAMKLASGIKDGSPAALTDGSAVFAWRLPLIGEVEALGTGVENLMTDTYFFTGLWDVGLWTATVLQGMINPFGTYRFDFTSNFKSSWFVDIDKTGNYLWCVR